jgi:hypothetical protein
MWRLIQPTFTLVFCCAPEIATVTAHLKFRKFQSEMWRTRDMRSQHANLLTLFSLRFIYKARNRWPFETLIIAHFAVQYSVMTSSQDHGAKISGRNFVRQGLRVGKGHSRWIQRLADGLVFSFPESASKLYPRNLSKMTDQRMVQIMPCT